MITIERNPNGSYIATALVRDDSTPFTWYQSQVFYGYDKAEIRHAFKDFLKDNGFKIVRNEY